MNEGRKHLVRCILPYIIVLRSMKFYTKQNSQGPLFSTAHVSRKFHPPALVVAQLWLWIIIAVGCDFDVQEGCISHELSLSTISCSRYLPRLVTCLVWLEKIQDHHLEKPSCVSCQAVMLRLVFLRNPRHPPAIPPVIPGVWRCEFGIPKSRTPLRIYWGYNPFTNHLLTCWGILVFWKPWDFRPQHIYKKNRRDFAAITGSNAWVPAAKTTDAPWKKSRWKRQMRPRHP